MPGERGTYYANFGEEPVVKPVVENKPAAEVSSPNAPENAPANAGFDYGNYTNAANWDRKTMRLINRTGAQRIDIGDDGNLAYQNIGAGTSMRDLRRIRRDARQDNKRYLQDQQNVNLAANQGLNYESGIKSDNEYMRQIVDLLATKGNAYAIYRQKQAEGAVPAAGENTSENEPAEETTPPVTTTEEPEYQYTSSANLSNLWNTRNANALQAMISNGKNFDIFGGNNVTADSIKAWQQKNNLTADGLIGWNSLGLLNSQGYLTNDQLTELRKGMVDPTQKSKTREQKTPSWMLTTQQMWNGTYKFKQGGELNMQYFQAGGAVNAQQVNAEQAQAQQAQLTEIFQAVAADPQGALQKLAQQGIQPKQIIELAQKMSGSNSAAREALSALQQMSQMAKQGTKLAYIKFLRNEAPEGYEIEFYKTGGCIGKRLKKVDKDCNGKKLPKKENGGETALVSEFKQGRKVKKGC